MDFVEEYGPTFAVVLLAVLTAGVLMSKGRSIPVVGSALAIAHDGYDS